MVVLYYNHRGVIPFTLRVKSSVSPALSTQEKLLAAQLSFTEKLSDTFCFFFYQVFKVFLLCLAVLVAVSSAEKVCTCEDKEVNKSDAFLI